MSKRKFLMVTDANTDTRIAIPVQQIIQIREYEHDKDHLARIQYHGANNQPTAVSTKEFFYDIMTGCHTFKL